MSRYLGKVSYQNQGHVVLDQDIILKDVAAGIDVHSAFLSVTVLQKNDVRSNPSISPNVVEVHFQEFPVGDEGFNKLREFLSEFDRLKDIALEATATYWRPVYNALYQDYTIIVVNPSLIKSLSKTDRQDAIKLAKLNLTGLLKKSFIPDEHQFELRILTRQRRKVIQERTRNENRLNTQLLNGNLTIGKTISMSSVSARKMIKAIICGERDAKVVAEMYLGTKNVEAKIQQLEDGLQELAYISQSTLFTLSSLIKIIEELLRQQKEYDAWITNLIDQYEIVNPRTGDIRMAREAYNLIVTVDGGSRVLAETFIAEAGIDMSKFATDLDLVSWAGFNPQARVTGGRKISAGTSKGNKYLHSVVIQIAQGLLQGHKGRNPLAQYGWDYLGRSGGNRKMAASAVGRRIIKGLWHVLGKWEPWSNSGYDKSEEAKRQIKGLKKVVRQLESIEKLTAKNEEAAELRLRAAQIAGSLLGQSKVDYTFLSGTKDVDISEIKLKNRIVKVLKKAEKNKVSEVVFAIFNETIIQIPGFGEKSLLDTIEALIQAGFITPQFKQTK